MLPAALRKLTVLTALVAGFCALNAREAKALGHHKRAATSSSYCQDTSQQAFVDQCVVYRWDWCTFSWVQDSVYYGNLWYAQLQANWRVQQLSWCGISAYSQCFVARADVYVYNRWTCRWELYRWRTTPQQAAWDVWHLQCQGHCAYYHCYLVPIYHHEASASPTQQSPASTPAPAPAPQH